MILAFNHWSSRVSRWSGSLQAASFRSIFRVQYGIVLIPHLDPNHESQMAALLSKVSPWPVIEVTQGMAAETRHVYVIPPTDFLTIHDGVFLLSRPSESQSFATAIDVFLRSLAKDQANSQSELYFQEQEITAPWESAISKSPAEWRSLKNHRRQSSTRCQVSSFARALRTTSCRLVKCPQLSNGIWSNLM